MIASSTNEQMATGKWNQEELKWPSSIPNHGSTNPSTGLLNLIGI